MDMQDNEFDKLFHSKLNAFEAEPSIKVWDDINGELNTGKRKKALISLLSIAASIIVLITAGMLFIPQKAKVNSNKRLAKNDVIKTVLPPVAGSIVKNNQSSQGLKYLSTHQQSKMVAAIHKPANLHNSIPSGVIYTPTAVSPAQPFKTVEQAGLASAVRREITADLVIPDKVASLSTMEHVEAKLAFADKPVALQANPIPAINKPDANPVKTEHKIHRLGDLINFVVAKVDKRQDKIIEFDSTDDDETRITGVNLGIIKIKKDQ